MYYSADYLKNSVYNFDSVIKSMAKYVNSTMGPNYPKFNLVESDGKYILEFALSGFKKDEISLKTEDNLLTLSGKSNSSKEKKYLYRGLALRNFEISFNIGDKMKVSSVKFENGLLEVELEKIVPLGRELKVWL